MSSCRLVACMVMVLAGFAGLGAHGGEATIAVEVEIQLNGNFAQNDLTGLGQGVRITDGPDVSGKVLAVVPMTFLPILKELGVDHRVTSQCLVLEGKNVTPDDAKVSTLSYGSGGPWVIAASPAYSVLTQDITSTPAGSEVTNVHVEIPGNSSMTVADVAIRVDKGGVFDSTYCVLDDIDMSFSLSWTTSAFSGMDVNGSWSLMGQAQGGGQASAGNVTMTIYYTEPPLTPGIPTLAQSEISCGGAAELSVDIANPGTAEIPASTGGWYAGTSDTMTPSVLLQSVNIPAVPAGGSVTVSSENVPWPSQYCIPGAYYVSFKTDAFGPAASITVVAIEQPDLAVAFSSSAPVSIPAAGGDLTLEATVLNKGNMASGGFKVAWYLAADAQPTTGSLKIWESGEQVSLMPDARITVKETVTVPSLPDESRMYSLACHVESTVAEANVENNWGESVAIWILATGDALPLGGVGTGIVLSALLAARGILRLRRSCA